MKYLFLSLVSLGLIFSSVTFAKAPSNSALNKEINKLAKQGNVTRKISDKGLKIAQETRIKANQTRTMLTTLGQQVSDLEGMDPFNDLTPEQISKLKSQLNLIDGSYSQEFTLDCSQDPQALENAYRDNRQYRELYFNITGSCFADFSNMTQVHHQTVKITGPEQLDAELIANPDSGNLFVGSLFGGGLYLENLTVNLPANDRSNIFFGRNGEGQLSNVKVLGGKNAVILLAGAQAYFYNTEITGAQGISVLALSGAKLRFFGDFSIQSDHQGLVIGGASIVRSQSDNVIITAANEAIVLSQGSSYFANHGLLKANGLLRIDTQANMQLTKLELQGELDLNYGSLRVNNSASFNGKLNLQAGQLQLWGGGSITGDIHMYQGSIAEIHNQDENKFVITGAGQLGNSIFSSGNIHWTGDLNASGSEISIDNAEIFNSQPWFINNGANIHLSNAEVNTTLHANTNAGVYLYSVNIGLLEIHHASLANINDSQVGTLNIYQNSDASLHNVTINGTASTDWNFKGIAVGRMSTISLYKDVKFSAGLNFDLNHSEAFIGQGTQLNGTPVGCYQLSVLDVEGGIDKLTTEYGGVLNSPCFDPYSGQN